MYMIARLSLALIMRITMLLGSVMNTIQVQHIFMTWAKMVSGCKPKKLLVRTEQMTMFIPKVDLTQLTRMFQIYLETVSPFGVTILLSVHIIMITVHQELERAIYGTEEKLMFLNAQEEYGLKCKLYPLLFLKDGIDLVMRLISTLT